MLFIIEKILLSTEADVLGGGLHWLTELLTGTLVD